MAGVKRTWQAAGRVTREQGIRRRRRRGREASGSQACQHVPDERGVMNTICTAQWRTVEWSSCGDEIEEPCGASPWKDERTQERKQECVCSEQSSNLQSVQWQRTGGSRLQEQLLRTKEERVPACFAQSSASPSSFMAALGTIGTDKK